MKILSILLMAVILMGSVLAVQPDTDNSLSGITVDANTNIRHTSPHVPSTPQVGGGHGSKARCYTTWAYDVHEGWIKRDVFVIKNGKTILMQGDECVAMFPTTYKVIRKPTLKLTESWGLRPLPANWWI